MAVLKQAPRAALRKMLCGGTAALLLSFGLGAGAAESSELQDEHRLRAAMVYKLMLFVDWPAQDPAGPELQLCIVSGDVELTRAFAALAGRPVRDRTLRVQRRGPLADLEDCNAVYLNGLGQDLLADKLRSLERKPVLTVSSSYGSGAMIDLGLSDNRLAFEVSATILRNAGLSLASRVMQLARAVHR